MSATRKRVHRGFGLAAVLALAGLGSSFVPPPTPLTWNALLDEASPYRVVEAQLSGRFHYQPCQRVLEKEASVPAVVCPELPSSARVLAAKLYSTLGDLTGNPSPERLHLAALALLVASGEHKLPEAIALLEDARQLAPEDPAIASDLGALHLELASREDRPTSLLAAIEVLEPAFDSHPTPELAFNRALALEMLRLPINAGGAWEQYLYLERSGPWASEARHRLEQLRRRLVASSPQALLREAAAREDQTKLRLLAREHPQAALEVAMFEFLGAWGLAELKGRSQSLSFLAAARTVGEELAAIQGERSVIEAVETIEKASSPRLRRRLARAHRSLAKAHVSHEARLPPTAQPFISAAALLGIGRGRVDPELVQLEARIFVIDYAEPWIAAAERSLGSSPGPARGWTELARANSLLLTNRLPQAGDLFEALARRYSSDRYPALNGRAFRGLGLVRSRQGLLEESLAAYREAAKIFEKAREPASQGSTLALIAEVLQWLGDEEGAWQQRLRAFELLELNPNAIALSRVHRDAIAAALKGGNVFLSSLLSEEEGQRSSMEGHPPEKLGSFPVVYINTGRPPKPRQALEDLRQAEMHARRVRSGRPIALIQAERLWEQAVQYASERFVPTCWFIASHLTGGLKGRDPVTGRSRPLLECGQVKSPRDAMEFAEQRLFSSLWRVEWSRKNTGSPTAQRALLAAWQPVFDGTLAFMLDDRRPALARQVFEASHGAQLDQPEPTPEGLPSDLTVLEFAAHPDFLASWQLDPHGWQSRRALVSSAERRQRITSFTAALTTNESSWEAAREVGRPLAELLLPRNFPTGGRLCIVVQRELAGLPFASLPHPTTDRPLVESTIVSFADSATKCVAAASAKVDLDSEEHRRPILLVHPPASDLRFAKEEAMALLKLYPDALDLSGAKATREAVLAELPKARFLHFAGHVWADSRQPELSRMQLAGESRTGTLTAEDIEAQNLAGLDLAVLAGCTTYTHRSLRPEGLSGLGRAFLDAGAGAVLGTLWNVDDKATRTLMEYFYRDLRDHGDPAVALATAQRQMLASTDPELASPAAWAGFLLMTSGNWSESSSSERP